jgi:hypothetical protein
VSDALYLLSTLCATNWLGLPCNRSAAAALCSSCGCAAGPPSGVGITGTGPLLSIRGCTAPGNCSVAMSNWAYNEGCCAATAAAAEARRAAITAGHPALGARFRVAWGGGAVSQFQSAAPCPKEGSRAPVDWVDPACIAGGCGVGRSVWPAACCSPAAVACANGAPAYPGACTCSCPAGWTGPRCGGRVPHARVSVRARGLTRRAWMMSPTSLEGLTIAFANVAGVMPSAVEVDSFRVATGPELTQGRGRRAAATDGLDVDVRVLCSSSAQVRSLTI